MKALNIIKKVSLNFKMYIVLHSLLELKLNYPKERRL